MHKRYYTKKEIVYIIEAVGKDIPEFLIAELLGRPILSVRKKINSLGLFYPNRIENQKKILKSKNFIEFKRQQSAEIIENYMKKLEEQELQNRLSRTRIIPAPKTNSTISEEWETKLSIMGVEFRMINGMKAMFRFGKPITTREIMEFDITS